MSRKLIGLLSGIIIICLIITGVFALGNKEKITRIEFPTIGGNLPEDITFTLSQDIIFSDNITANAQGSTDKIYKLSLQLKNKEERIEKLKKIFKIDTGTKTDMGEVITFQNENSTLDINENGTFSFTRKTTDSSQAVTLSDKECINLAENFLKENNLLPDGFFENGVAYETKTSVNNPKNSTVVKKDIYFNRKVDGKIVYGVSRIIVSVGSNAQINSVYSLYRDFEESPTPIKIKSFDAAFHDLKQLKGSVRTSDSTKSVEITNVELVYWEDSTPYSKQTHIQPVFHFRGEAIDNKGNKDDTFEAFVSAIPDDFTSEINESNSKPIPSDKKQPVKSLKKPSSDELPKKFK